MIFSKKSSFCAGLDFGLYRQTKEDFLDAPSIDTARLTVEPIDDVSVAEKTCRVFAQHPPAREELAI